MSTYPARPRAAFLQWCEGHAPVFTAQATNIGLTAAQATAFATATTAVSSGILAQEQAKQAYRVATQQVEDGLAALRSSAGDTVRLIRAFAESTSKPNDIYNLAQIPPPAQPSPAPPPGSPTEFRIELLQAGPLRLTWKCANPAGVGGTTYEVMRRVGGGAFTYVGTTGRRAFLDETLPSGVGAVTYQVTATRSTSRGTPAQFTVNFGVGAGGTAFIAGVNGDAAVVDRTHGDSTAGRLEPSTVNGNVVRKTLPDIAGGGKRSKSRM